MENYAIIIKSSGCGADGSALPWGGRGRWFKSSHSDQVEPGARYAPGPFVWWIWRSWLARQIVALKAVGSNPTIHPSGESPPINAHSRFVGAFCFCPRRDREDFGEQKARSETRSGSFLHIDVRVPRRKTGCFPRLLRRRLTRAHILWVRFVFVPRRDRKDFGEQKARSGTRFGSFLYIGVRVPRRETGCFPRFLAADQRALTFCGCVLFLSREGAGRISENKRPEAKHAPGHFCILAYVSNGVAAG